MMAKDSGCVTSVCRPDGFAGGRPVAARQARAWRRTSCKSFSRRAISPGPRGRRRGGRSARQVDAKKRTEPLLRSRQARAMLRAMNVRLKYRGRVVTDSDVTFIQELIAAHPTLSRRALSKKLCEAWNWVQPNGHPRDMVCRGLMLALHRAGHIELPNRQHAPPNPLAKRSRPPAAADSMASAILNVAWALGFCGSGHGDCGARLTFRGRPTQKSRHPTSNGV